MGNVLRGTSTGFTVNVVSPGMLTGVDETPSNVSSVSVYPNPVTDRIIISGTEGAAGFRIMDLRGSLVGEGVLTAGENVLDATSLATGSYLIEVIRPDGNRIFRRFMRQ
jgi:hypothetical protein